MPRSTPSRRCSAGWEVDDGAAAKPVAAHRRRDQPRRPSSRRAIAGRRGLPAPGLGRPRAPARRSSCRRTSCAAAPLGAAGGGRARTRAALHRPVGEEPSHRQGHLPARQLHDEVQPEGERGSGAPGQLPRRCTRCRTTADTQGALEVLWQLQSCLAEITGMEAFALQPAAGRARRVPGHEDDPAALRHHRPSRARRDHHSRLGARHQPGQRAHGRHAHRATASRAPTATSTWRGCARALTDRVAAS